MIFSELRSSRANLSARWNGLAVRENPLPSVADHEFVVQQGACGCGARLMTANPLPCAIAGASVNHPAARLAP